MMWVCLEKMTPHAYELAHMQCLTVFNARKNSQAKFSEHAALFGPRSRCSTKKSEPFSSASPRALHRCRQHWSEHQGQSKFQTERPSEHVASTSSPLTSASM